MVINSSPYKNKPKGLQKILYIHWPLSFLISVVSFFGFLMMYSVADGDYYLWSHPQLLRFSFGMVVLILISQVDIDFWRSLSPFIYTIALVLLFLVQFFGDIGMGARRWLEIGSIRFQPSEIMKVGLVLMLAIYYDWLSPKNISKPIWVAIPLTLILFPAWLVIIQPDLGTGMIIAITGITIMFVAGVNFWYFMGALTCAGVAIFLVFVSRNKSWQLLYDYHFNRIDIYLNPALDPLGRGYHITQSKIALGSGGLNGKGFMQGSQSQLDFLPEKHTDFIFTTIAEEFGFFGGIGLLTIYGTIVLFCLISAIRNHNRFGRLVTVGLAMIFFSYFAVNIAMVTGLAPVVGVPLPLISYGGSAMLVIMGSFGLIQSAHVHRLTKRE